MILKRIAAVVMTAAFVLSAGAVEKDSLSLVRQNKARYPGKTKTELRLENDRLRKDLDSLRCELERYRRDLNIADSINNDLMTIYAGNAQNTSGIAPEEYTAEISDSLLNIWYAHRLANDAEDIEAYDMDSVKFQSNVPDSVYIDRIALMNSFITLPYNDIVKNYIRRKSRQIMGIKKEYCIFVVNKCLCL